MNDRKYTFLIEYKVIGRGDVVLKSGKTRCKNQFDGREAKEQLKLSLLRSMPHATKIKFIGDPVNETLEEEGNGIAAMFRRNRRIVNGSKKQ